MSVRPLARLRALGILTGTWWLHQTMFPSGLNVFVGPMLVLSIMGGVEGAQTAARCGTIVLGIAGGMEPVGRLGARRGTIVLSLKWPNRKLKGRRCVVFYYNEKMLCGAITVLLCAVQTKNQRRRASTGRNSSTNTTTAICYGWR